MVGLLFDTTRKALLHARQHELIIRPLTAPHLIAQTLFWRNLRSTAKTAPGPSRRQGPSRERPQLVVSRRRSRFERKLADAEGRADVLRTDRHSPK